jgi:hypothetical protein
MNTFIRIIELWLPDRSRTKLTFGGGMYGEFTAFQSASEAMQFEFDQGLPGKAWASRHPIILKEFSNSYFQRTEAAKAAGLTCGVALPVFAGDFLLAVLVLFCGDDADHVGAIELWHNDPKIAYGMKLVDGYFGTADMFEFNARHTKFPPGYGLPGRTWKAKMPLLIKDLHNSKRFLRWEQATEIGINLGIGIPFETGSEETWVMTFLSAQNTPIARRFEIWIPNQSNDALVFQAGDCHSNADLDAIYAAKQIAKGEGSIGTAWRTGVPALSESLQSDVSVAGASAREAGMKSAVVLPVLKAGQMTAAVAWYL